MNTELEAIEQRDPAKLFTAKGIGPLLKAIEKEATAELPDVTTPDGRKAITSLAYKVARSKTTIDDLGKDYVAGIKQQAAVVDEVRRTARDFLDNLKGVVRRPLTEWEDAEAARVAKIQGKINNLHDLGDTTDDNNVLRTVAELEAQLKQLRATKITKIYAEYQDEAINAVNASIVALTDAIPKAADLEREAENAAQEAAQEAEDRRIEEEQRIAREAVEAAEIESQRELQAIQEQAAQEAADKEKREKDTRHKGRINREAVEALVTVNPSCDEVLAKQIVKSIVQGKIDHITINY